MPLHAQQIGNGGDVVLLHGWGMHSGIFQPLVDALADHYRLTLIDLPGHGLSDAIDACDIEAWLDELRAVAPVNAVWVGWSLGGMLATVFAQHYPDRVSKLVLLAASPKFTASDDWPHAMQPNVLQGFAQSLLQDTKNTLKRFLSLVALGGGDQDVLRSLRSKVMTERLPSVSGLVCGLNFLADLDVRQAFSTLSMPVLAIMGLRDMLVPIGAVDDMRALNAGLIVYVIEQAGHAPFLSHTTQCAQHMKDFMQ